MWILLGGLGFGISEIISNGILGWNGKSLDDLLPNLVIVIEAFNFKAWLCFAMQKLQKNQLSAWSAGPGKENVIHDCCLCMDVEMP